MAEWDNVIDDWYDQALANGQGFKSEEEKKAYLDSLGDPLDHPMFATSAEQIARHPLGDAFRLLKEEDKTAYELAVMYKDEGNEFMRGKTSEDYRNAIDKYDQALPFVPPYIKYDLRQAGSHLYTRREGLLTVTGYNRSSPYNP